MKIFYQGLRTNITIIFVVVLLVAMILLDVVMIFSAQHVLIRSETAKAHLFISAIGNSLMNLPDSNEVVLDSVMEDSFDRMFDDSGIYCAMVVNRSRQLYYMGNCVDFQDILGHLAIRSIETNQTYTLDYGSTWGVFWRQSENLIISAPLSKKGKVAAGCSVVLQFTEVYAHLRRIQYILLIFIAGTTVVLTLIGLHRLFKMTVKPVHQLLERTEDYTDFEEKTGGTQEEETDEFENEFKRLSRAFNRMLDRISRDNIELKETVKSLEKANEELHKAHKDIIRAEKLASVGRLAAGVAHEIGNPISIVVGYLGLLQREDMEDAEKKEFVKRAESEINRIHSIIRQLLDFSRPSTGDPEMVSIHEIIDSVGEMVQFQPQMSNITLDLKFDAKKDMVFADPSQLRQVLLNLIINAADAISSVKDHPNGTITLETRNILNGGPDFDHKPLVQLSCKDNGPGISRAHMGNIFDPFFTTKEPGKGTGLGLSVSFRILESMGSRIKAYSTPGKGTTMTIRIPLYE